MTGEIVFWLATICVLVFVLVCSILFGDRDKPGCGKYDDPFDDLL